jgi:hypothetical protein
MCSNSTLGAFLQLVLLYSLVSLIGSVALESKDPIDVLFCSSFGGNSHIKPLLEYGIKLKEAGHKVTVAALKEQEKLVQKYNLDLHLLSNQTINVWDVMDPVVLMQCEYNMDNVGLLLPLLTEANILVYKSLQPWFEERKRNGKLPNVVAVDMFTEACGELAETYGVPFIVTSSLLGHPG